MVVRGEGGGGERHADGLLVSPAALAPILGQLQLLLWCRAAASEIALLAKQRDE